MEIKNTVDKMNSKLKEQVIQYVKSFFPIEGHTHVIKLDKVELEQPEESLANIKQLKISDGSYVTNVYTTLSLYDTQGNKLDSSRILFLVLPKMTPQGTFMLEGTDYNIPIQLRLKAGVYHRIQPNGIGEARFNLSQGLNFRVHVDLFKKRIYITINGKTIDLVNLLRGLGVSDQTMEQAWGKDLFKTLVIRGTPDEAVVKMHNAIFNENLDTTKAVFAADELRHYFKKNTEMDPAVNTLTLKKPYDRVTLKSIVDAVAKTLKVLSHEASPDETSSILYKKALWIPNFTDEVLKKHMILSIKNIQRRIDKYNSIDKILYGSSVKYAIPNFLKKASISQALPAQNPISIVDALEKVTLMGEGGFRDSQAVSIKDRSLNPYQIGFLDPIHTPESEKLGVNLYKAKNATINTDKRELLTKVYNLKTHHYDWVTPMNLYNKYVAYPGEGKINKSGTVKWTKDKVHVLHQNQIEDVEPSKVQYLFPDPQSMFDLATNLTPFLDSNQGNRAMMTGKHMSQSIALSNPELPLVDPIDSDGKFFTEKIGENFAIKSPVNGVVSKIDNPKSRPSYIYIKDSSGKEHKVEYIDYIPTTDTYYVGYHPIVKVGDKVTKGQVIADSNFTKNGRLAMGRNMRVGYVSYKGYNHEDGIIVSESATKKLASTHIETITGNKKENIEYNKTKFQQIFRNMFTIEQLNKLDSRGIVKEGVKLEKGDPVIVAIKDRLDIGDLQSLDLSQQLFKNKLPYIKTWESDATGTVQDVVETADNYKIYIKFDQPLKLGDKIVGRHGNKGVVSLILPDEKMPTTEDGKPLEIMLNPHGITSRVNPSQLLETSLANYAKKTGQPQAISNFSDHDNVEYVISKLLEVGLTDKQKIIDPENGPLTNPTTVGYQYIIKLPQRADTKLSVRERPGYDLDDAPLQGGGSHASARAIDILTLYSLVAHNKRNLLREFATYKASKNEAVTKALTSGGLLPAPQPTGTWNKFIAMMKGMGINVEKNGTMFALKPMTDKDIEEARLQEVKAPKLFQIKYGKVTPEEQGLYDPFITGGPNGDKWSYIDLKQKIPNPLYEKQIQHLLGITKTQYQAIIENKLFLQNGQLVDKKQLDKTQPYKRGMEVLHQLAKDIDENGGLKKKEEEFAQKMVAARTTSEKERYSTDIQYIRGLRKNNIKLQDLFISKIPVLPPKYRPAYESEDGSLRMSPLSLLYRQLLQLAEQYDKKKKMGVLTPRTLATYQKNTYKALSELVGTKNSTTATNTELEGILQTLNASEGNSPKTGFIQRKVIRKSQDYSGGAVITPGPELGMNEVGLPYDLAVSLYRPFLIRRLTSMGLGMKEAVDALKNKDRRAVIALQEEMKDRPVLVNRAPSLHKFSIQALKPVLVDGRSIKMNAMVLKGYNADFDGDTVAVHLPITNKGKEEAKEMLPSKNIFSIGTGSPITKFRLEYVTGLFQITQPSEQNKTNDKLPVYTDYSQLLHEYLNGDLDPLETIKYNDKITTVGRAVVNGILPKDLQQWDKVFNAKLVNSIVGELAKKYPDRVEDIVNTLMKISLVGMYKENPGVGISDLKLSEKEKNLRDLAFSIVEDKKDPSIDKKRKNLVLVTQHLIDFIVNQKAKDPNELKNNGFVNMYASGAKGSNTQLLQLLAAPVAVQGPDGKTVPVPIKNSYAHGLTPFEYFTSGYGARFGMVAKKEMVAQPGALNKEILNSISNMVVSKESDPDNPGIALDPKKTDPTGRLLAQDVKDKDGKIIAKKGTLINGKLANLLKDYKGFIYVKSPMTDTTPYGIAADSVGWDENQRLPKIGENIGVKSGQSVAEPLSQLSMSLFHTGGVAGDENSDATNIFGVIQQLLRMPTTGQTDEVLSKHYGTVKKIEKTPTGHDVYVENNVYHITNPLVPIVKKGQKVRKGDPLSSGTFNPSAVAAVRSIPDAQLRLKDTLDKLLKLAGNHLRPNILETVVGGLTQHVLVTKSQHPDYPAGSYAAWPVIFKEGKQNAKELDVDKAIGYRTAKNYGSVLVNTLIDEEIVKELKDQGITKVLAFKDPVEYTPLWKGSARQTLISDDWLHKLSFRELKKVIPQSTVQGNVSDVAGYSPITAWMYGPTIGYGEFGKYGSAAEQSILKDILTTAKTLYNKEETTTEKYEELYKTTKMAENGVLKTNMIDRSSFENKGAKNAKYEAGIDINTNEIAAALDTLLKNLK